MIRANVLRSTNPTAAGRWKTFWHLVSFAVVAPAVYLVCSQAKGIRHSLLRDPPVFGPADWLAAQTTQPSGDITPLGFLVFLAVTTGTLVLYFSAYHVMGLYDQRRNDLRAEALFDSVVEAGRPAEPFVLYLRPFRSTGAYKVRMSYGNAVREYDLEFELSRAAKRLGAFVALGETLEHRGAGRIASTDAEWRHAAERLMQHARLIVMIPSSRPGTRWEIERLITSGWIAKTLFIDVPNSSATEYAQETEWEDIDRALSANGYQWPADNPEGRLIAFGTSTTPQLVEPLDFVGPVPLRAAMKRTLALAASARHARGVDHSGFERPQ